MIAILTISSIKAQDLIVLRDATEVQAKVTAITEESVTYKRWSNLEGPTYTISKANVFYIKYANGEKDIMQSIKPNNSLTLNKRNTQPLTPIKFQGYGYLGAIFNANGAGPSADIIFGMRIYEYLYLGIQTGFHSPLFEGNYSNTYYVDAYIPIGVNMKGYFTRGRKVNPYINCTLGGFIGVCDFEGINSFHCQVGAGIDVQRFSFGIGYNGLVKDGTASCGYIQLGIRFGKN